MVAILKAMIFYADGKSPPAICPAVEAEGKFWLVPKWIEAPDKRSRRPKYIIPLDAFQHQRVHDQKTFDLIVNEGLPRQFFADEIPIGLKNEYRIVDSPDWKFGM